MRLNLELIILIFIYKNSLRVWVHEDDPQPNKTAIACSRTNDPSTEID